MERPAQRRDAGGGLHAPDLIPSRNRRSIDAIAALVIAFAIALMAGPQITQGGLGWSDAPNHTFDGIFILDFIRAWPIDHARAWAEQFYLRYPALGILVYYPPGFAVLEAISFAILCVTLLAAR